VWSIPIRVSLYIMLGLMGFSRFERGPEGAGGLPN